MSELAIVIVSYNARADLEACLDSVTAHPPRHSYEIVVVDNASHDGSADAVRRGWPAITVIDVGDNIGFSRATNLGIQATDSRLILLLNSDTVVPADALDRLVSRLEARLDAAVIGPRLVDSDGALEISFGAMLSPWAELVQKCLVRGHAAGLPGITGLAVRRARTERTVDWVSGACLLVRRVDAVAAGLLDELFFLYGEDVDFCHAIRQLGRSVVFTPAAEVVHQRGRSGRYAPAATAAAYRRSQLAFYRKHHPRWLPV
ncbi:MAG: glycosyltransferase family 2 protein, partial [Acidobacteriota bacterium]|nr:glycosyltransferase family 2 protein [Acidobacteriota bacterium]